MLTNDQASAIVNKQIPNGKIQGFVVYNGMYIFQVFTDDPFEGTFDPFYSVDQNTGEFKEFSVLNGDGSNVISLFK